MVELFLGEVFYDFYDWFKMVIQGYGLFDYEIIDYCFIDLVKVDILVNGDKVDVFSQFVYCEKVCMCVFCYCECFVEMILWQQFKIVIQGLIGGQIIVCMMISVFCKDVIVKCYGGDISCKCKLFEKQCEGKKWMKMVGNIEILQEVFVLVFKIND